MAGRFSVETVFKAIDRISKPVSRMQQRVRRFTDTSSRGFRQLNKTITSVNAGLKKGAVAATLALGLAGGAMADVVNVGADFEQTLVNATAKFPGEIRKGTSAFEELADVARKTGSTTEFSASQAAGGLNFLAAAGFNAEQAMAALPGLVDLATAAQTDLATASDIATDSLGALNLMTKDAAQLQTNLTRVSDSMAFTAARANTDLEMMFEALKKGGPVATAAGADVETVNTLIAKMADSGIKASEAGTALKNIFLAMGAPTSQAAKVMRKLGVQVTDADGNMRDALDVFKDFSKTSGELSQSAQLQVFDQIFGKIPIAAAINLTNAADSMHGFRDEMRAASGQANKMATIMRDTVRGSMNSLSSAIEGVKLKLFDLESGTLKDTIDRTTDWVRANEDLIASKVGDWLTFMIDNFSEIVFWLKTIGIAVGVWVTFTSIINGFITVMTAVNLVMTANPIGLIIVGVAALIGLVAVLAARWKPLGNFFKSLWGGITLVFQAAVTGIQAHIDRVMGAVDRVRSAASTVGSFLGFGGDDDEGDAGAGRAAASAAVSSPQERTARSIEERNTTSTATLNIRDESGRGELSGQTTNGLSSINLIPTGSF